MSAPEPGGRTTGRKVAEGNAEGRYSDEATIQEERTHRQMTQSGKHLAVRHRDWGPDGIGEAHYVHALWILRWKGNDSTWSKINRMSEVGAELEIPIRDKGGIGKQCQ